MCLSQQHPRSALASPPLVRDADDAKAFTATLDAMATKRPSWTLRGVFKQPSSRPGLPRRFHTKINLNEYWGALEKVVKVEVSWPRPRPAAPKEAMDVDNEVNENLANERTEAEQNSRMDVDEDKAVAAEVSCQDVVHQISFDVPPAPHKDVAHVEVPVAEVKVPEVKVTEVKVTEVKVPEVKVADITLSQRTASPAKKSRRRSLPATPRPPPPCGSPPCGAAAPACRRVPLGTINGLDSRAQLRKSLSPLSVFADNLARRLARQH